MLVAAFEIEVGGPALVGPAAAFQREDMGAAAVEPDVEDVGDALVIGRRRRPAPRSAAALSSDQASTPGLGTAATIRALTAGSTSSSPVLRSTNSAIGTPQARWRLITQSGRPSTIDADPVAALFGHEAGVGDGAAARAGAASACASSAPPSFSQRCSAKLSQCSSRQRPVHRDEPLRGAAVDDLGLRAPAVRVAVLDNRRTPRAVPPASRRSLQIGPSGALNLALMTLPWPPSHAQSSRYLPSASTANSGSMPMRLAQLEIVLAMVGRHVDQAGAALGGDELAGQERPRLGEEAAEMVHRVAGDGAGEVGALKIALFRSTVALRLRAAASMSGSSSRYSEDCSTSSFERSDYLSA